ncbi:MAG: 4Fe-4S cluster-binding domain-containing protein [Roseburia sp.]|nr:4Fe-4S cluster-binding domain-containing protein [Roseburia sp.]
MKRYGEIEIHNPMELQTVDRKNSILIVAIDRSTVSPVLQYFMNCGWILGNNLFLGQDFMEWYLEPYLFFHENKIYVKNLTICVSKKCTLKCKECSQRMSYQKELGMNTLKELTAHIDLLFSKIDFIDFLAVTGGEPFLFKELDRLLDYMVNRYGRQIGAIRVVSNGTIMPDENFLKCAQEHGILLELTDYGFNMDKIKQAEELCKVKGVCFVENRHEHWFKMWVKNRKSSKAADYIFDQCICHSRCDGYVDGKLVKCLCAYFAGYTYKELDTDEDYLALSGSTAKETVFEYLRGYTVKGHLSACEMCDGLYGINTEYTVLGGQA